MEDKNMELVEVIENIVENSEELEKLLKLKKFEDMYQLLKNNGYSKSPEVLREEVKEFMEEVLVDIENAELSKVSGGSLKGNLTKATSVGMASLLMLGASPMGSKASARGEFQSNGVKSPMRASVPVNSSKDQVSPKKSPRIPLIQGDNIVKAIGAVAAVVGVGALGGYGARTLQDKFFKPTQEPEVKTVERVVVQKVIQEVVQKETIEKETLIDYGEFIENHVGKCDESDRTKRKACAECIQRINNILDITGERRLSELTYGGFDVVNQTFIDSDGIGGFLCHAVTGYVCGESAGNMTKFQEEHFLRCLQGLVVFEAFAKEFQDSGKHEKIKRCIECLMDLLEKIDREDNEEEIEELKDALEFLPKLAKAKNLHNCAKFYENLGYMDDVYDFVVKLHNALEKKGINDDNIESIKIVYGNEECTLDDVITKEESDFIEKVIVKRTDSTTNTFALSSIGGIFTLKDDAAQPITE